MARRTRANPWLRLGFDAWALGLEASTVIGLRTLKSPPPRPPPARPKPAGWWTKR
jgi:hypothetical protein